MASIPLTAKADGATATKDGGKTETLLIGDATTPATANPPQKPTRPLTAYHLFFQLEREYIIQTTPPEKEEDSTAKISSNLPKDDRPIGRQLDEDMPFRYRYIHLSPYWYASGSGKRIAGANGKNNPTKKRKHRKTHGKISFLDLSKCIATKWAKLGETDNATKMYVHKIAARELEGYRKESKVFKAANVVEPLVKHGNVEDCRCDSCVPTGRSTGKSSVAKAKSSKHVPRKSDVKKKKKKKCVVPEAPLFGLKTNEAELKQADPMTGEPEKKMPSTTMLDVKGKVKPPPISHGASSIKLSSNPSPNPKNNNDPLNLRCKLEKQDTQETLVTSNVQAGMKPTDSNKTTYDDTNDFASDFSFHPVPSAYWRKYKNKRAKAKKQSSSHSNNHQSRRRSSEEESMRRRRSSNDDSSSQQQQHGNNDVVAKKMTFHSQERLRRPYISYDMPGGLPASQHRHSYTSASTSRMADSGGLQRGDGSSSTGNTRGGYSSASFDQGATLHGGAYHSSQMELENDMTSFLSRMKDSGASVGRHSSTVRSEQPGWDVLDDLHMPMRESNDMGPPDPVPVAAKDANDTVEISADDAAGLMNALSGEDNKT